MVCWWQGQWCFGERLVNDMFAVSQLFFIVYRALDGILYIVLDCIGWSWFWTSVFVVECNGEFG